MTFFIQRKSLHGRMLGISSSGGLVMSVKTTSANLAASSDINMAAQMWGPGMIQTIGAGATATRILNSGLTYFTTGSSAAALYSMAAPAAGVVKTLVFQLASTLLTLNTTATTILFQTSTAHLSSTAGSSALTVTSSDGVGTAATLVGLSTTQWLLLSRRSTHVA